MRIFAIFALILSTLVLAACNGSVSDSDHNHRQGGLYIGGSGGAGF
jgi:hypothetical protein